MSVFDFNDFDTDADSYPMPEGPYLPDAADCMRCGLCLNSCPTYRLSGEEDEGPRQRVRSLRRLLQERQVLEDDAVSHLDNCIQCRACESVCPSRMDYGQCFDQAQESLQQGKKHGFLARIAFALIARKKWLKALLPVVTLYSDLGLQGLFRKLKIIDGLNLKQLDRLARKPTVTGLRTHYPVLYPKGSVALFTGCIGEHFDQETLSAAIKVLNRIGYDVLIPECQGCCGAIHYHNGHRQAALGLMSHNIEVFQALPAQAIIYCATGCGAQLQDYPNLLSDEDRQAETFANGLVEISDFVLEHWPKCLHLRPFGGRILVHEPCSQRNVLKNQQSVYRLLEKIPDCRMDALDDNGLCCGAGGSYMLTHPENAAALAAMKWKSVKEKPCEGLLTSNIGCAIHLAGAESADAKVKIRHPIQLIAELLED